MMTEQAKALRKLMEIDFAIHETVLYLDGHPNNKKALDFYKKASEARKQIYENYTMKHGPINSNDVKGNAWSWVNEPWPWQNMKGD